MLRTLAAFVIIVYLCEVKLVYCGQATVPHKVCSKYVDIFIYPTLNCTVDDVTFIDEENLLALITQHSEFSSSECNNKLLTFSVNRTLHRNGDILDLAEYGVTIQPKQGINLSSLPSNLDGFTLNDCKNKISDILVLLRRDRKFFSVRTNSTACNRADYEIDDVRGNPDCKSIAFCPQDSEEINGKCECSKGTYLNATLETCKPCPKASYQEFTGMFNCTRCEEGYTTKETGSRNRAECKVICDKGHYLTRNCCLPCPKNTYQNSPYSTSCKPCPNGQVTSVVGANDSSSCKVCDKGHYFMNNSCHPCPKDTYQNSTNTTSCKPCPNGQVTLGVGANDISSCKAPPGSNNTKVLAIVLPICVSVVLLIAGILLYHFWKKKRRREEERQEISEFELQEKLKRFERNFKVIEFHDSEDDETEQETEAQSISTLGHLAEDVEKRGLEIPREYITLTRTRLGRGNFGEVQQVIVRKPGKPEQLCAAKMARGSKFVSTKNILRDMQDELEIHLKLDQTHENVVNLIGVCSDEAGPFYLIIEYCGNGSLIEFLRNHENIPEYVNTAKREQLSQEWKLNCALEICSGMEFLAKHKIVHRDLAARNVLLDVNRVAKISDFGMAKDVYLTSYYKQRHEGSFPLRWMATESIHSLDFTEKSDVWSFGVLCWEIFTNGKHPYYDIIDDQKVAEYILSNQKLAKPEDCPQFLYDIMLTCWSEKKINRPTFRALYVNLKVHTFKIREKHAGKSMTRRLSQGVLETFNNTKRSVKRRLSRKSSNQSQESIVDHRTNPRRTSLSSLDQIIDNKNMELEEVADESNSRTNRGADKEVEIEYIPEPEKKENGSQSTTNGKHKKLVRSSNNKNSQTSLSAPKKTETSSSQEVDNRKTKRLEYGHEIESESIHQSSEKASNPRKSERDSYVQLSLDTTDSKPGEGSSFPKTADNTDFQTMDAYKGTLQPDALEATENDNIQHPTTNQKDLNRDSSKNKGDNSKSEDFGVDERNSENGSATTNSTPDGNEMENSKTLPSQNDFETKRESSESDLSKTLDNTKANNEGNFSNHVILGENSNTDIFPEKSSNHEEETNDEATKMEEERAKGELNDGGVLFGNSEHESRENSEDDSDSQGNVLAAINAFIKQH